METTYDEMINNFGTVELSETQLKAVNGGIFSVFLAAAAIYGGICTVAYGAGALYGILEK